MCHAFGLPAKQGNGAILGVGDGIGIQP